MLRTEQSMRILFLVQWIQHSVITYKACLEMIGRYVQGRKANQEIVSCTVNKHSVTTYQVWLEMVGRCVEDREIGLNIGSCT